MRQGIFIQIIKKKKLSTLRFFKSYQKMKRKEKERKKERIAKEKVQCAIE